MVVNHGLRNIRDWVQVEEGEVDGARRGYYFLCDYRNLADISPPSTLVAQLSKAMAQRLLH